MTHTKSDETIAEELQREWEKKYLKAADGSDADLYVAFIAGFEAGIAHERDRSKKLVDGLDAIASWHEGDRVTGSFDEPGSAIMARETLAEYRGEGK